MHLRWGNAIRFNIDVRRASRCFLGNAARVTKRNGPRSHWSILHDLVSWGTHKRRLYLELERVRARAAHARIENRDASSRTLSFSLSPSAGFEIFS